MTTQMLLNGIFIIGNTIFLYVAWTRMANRTQVGERLSLTTSGIAIGMLLTSLVLQIAKVNKEEVIQCQRD